MSNIAPGWYTDPTHTNTQRYWDGRTWTSQTAPATPIHTGPVRSRRPAGNVAAEFALLCAILGIFFPPLGIAGLALGIIAVSRARALGGLRRGSAILAVVLSAFEVVHLVTVLTPTLLDGSF
ncbi:DUF2510 domain-containing protein [Rathayibacter sp. Leaf248]|uniref:DUF2510 domain-containing protein n=1 Tax=Rathayibacter sp. Leaf248 TaxID=2876555 RepID=UPI001E30103D|nr:DUF2510 domain-containing protein [Rathayibacter sp. Leaf248]